MLDAAISDTGLYGSRQRPRQTYSFRELCEPAEIVAMVRLRHRVYFENNHYGPLKPLGLDLTAHDTRSRLYGVFRDAELIGGVRLVYRTEQASANVFRALRAVVGDATPFACGSLLPSEEAFDLHSVPGLETKDLQVEMGRFVLEGTARVPWLAPHAIVSLIAVVQAQRCPLYMYSCATTLAKQYARVTNPFWTLEQPTGVGIHSDGFVFPKPSVAAVARPEDGLMREALLDYAAQLHQTGVATLAARSARA
jgi:hypothetical protein